MKKPKRPDSYKVQQRKQRAARERRARVLDKIIGMIDEAIGIGLVSKAEKTNRDRMFSEPELQELNDARHSLMSVRNGSARERRR